MFDEIVSYPNLYRAAHAAARGKKTRDEVSFYCFLLERELDRLHDELVRGTYRHGRYQVFRISEPKPRDIAKAPFRDRVVHHAVHDVIEPLIDRSFIHDSYACRAGKGTHAALARARSFLFARNYCLHGDVRKYFPSIHRGILKQILSRHIADSRLWALLVEIIDSAGHIFPGDTGLPIGNLTSQFFANLYLHQLDRFVKHELKCRYYIRYMDDFLLFDDDPGMLERWRDAIGARLSKELGLRLHTDKTEVYSCRRGLTFLGFNMSRGRQRVSAHGMRRIRARLKQFRYLSGKGLAAEADMAASVMCWVAHSRYARTVTLRQQMACTAAQWSDIVPAVLLGN